MAESAGSPWRGLTRINIGAAGNFRSYTVSIADVVPNTASGDQADWDYQPGDSVTLRLEWDSVGIPTFDAANSATVRIRLLNDVNNIGSTWTPTIAGATGEATTTMKFSADPLAATGANVSGMIEAFLEVQRTVAVSWGPVDSRGGGTPPAATTNTWARGKFRAQTVLSAFSISDASLGGAEPAKFVATKTTFNRVTLQDVTYRAISLILKHRQASADVRNAVQDAAAGTGVTKDYTWNASATGAGNKGRINKDYAAASTATDVRIVLPATASGGTSNDLEYYLKSTDHIATWTRVDDSTLEKASRVTVDPRIQFSFLLQVNDNVWGTPPGSKNIASGQRLAADLGFIGSRALDMASTPAGLNSIVWTDKLWDANGLVGTEGSPVKSHSTTGATQGGEIGWGETATLPITWDNALPTGNWSQKTVITTADLTGLDTLNTRTLTLLAADPRIFIAMGAGDPANPSDHWYKGKALTIGATILNAGTKLVPDTNSVKFAVARFNPSTQLLEYLNTADGTVNTWTTLGATGTPTFYDNTTTPAVAAASGDANLFLLTFTAGQTGGSNWNSQDLFIVAQVAYLSVPYFMSGKLTVLGSGFPHAGAPDGSTLEFSGTTLRIKDLGVTIDKLSFDPATQVELDAHISAVTGVHGVGAGEVVGTTTTQTISNKTLGGNLAAGGFKVTGLATPTADTDAATKGYVDSIASGLDVKASVNAATTAALPAYTAAGAGVGKTLTANANGAFPSQDGVASAVNNRYLIKNEGASNTSIHNGIYVLTTLGDGSNPWVLTRATDADQNSEVTSGMFTFVSAGTTQGNTGWALVTVDPITVDATALLFNQFSSVSILAGDGLTKVGDTISVVAGDGINLVSDAVAMAPLPFINSVFKVAAALDETTSPRRLILYILENEILTNFVSFASFTIDTTNSVVRVYEEDTLVLGPTAFSALTNMATGKYRTDYTPNPKPVRIEITLVVTYRSVTQTLKYNITPGLPSLFYSIAAPLGVPS